MNINGKDLLLWASLLLIGLFIGGGSGFIFGIIGGMETGFQDGIEAGISYSNCIAEETPLYGTVTNQIENDCWEKYVYDSY